MRNRPTDGEFNYDDTKLTYTTEEMNILMSAMLSDMAATDFITLDEGMCFKQIFNTFMRMLVEDKETADRVLKDVRETENELKKTVGFKMKEDIEDEVWASLDKESPLGEDNKWN